MDWNGNVVLGHTLCPSVYICIGAYRKPFVKRQGLLLPHREQKRGLIGFSILLLGPLKLFIMGSRNLWFAPLSVVRRGREGKDCARYFLLGRRISGRIFWESWRLFICCDACKIGRASC